MVDGVARQIEWSQASVDGSGSLTVPLLGEWDDDWNDSFNEMLSFLMQETRGGVWGHVRLIRDAIVVEEVEKGSETALKEFLEAVVRQANSDVARRKNDQQQARSRAESEAADRASTAEGMTKTFRDFGSS